MTLWLKLVSVPVVCLLLAASVSGAAAQTTAARSSGATTTVRVAFLPLLTSAPLFVADELGFFQKHGVALAKTPTTNIYGMLAPLSQGQLDVLQSASSPAKERWERVMRSARKPGSAGRFIESS